MLLTCGNDRGIRISIQYFILKASASKKDLISPRTKDHSNWSSGSYFLVYIHQLILKVPKNKLKKKYLTLFLSS